MGHETPCPIVDSSGPDQYVHGRLMLSMGQVAQVVEQRPEKPCVDGSNPSLATSSSLKPDSVSCGIGLFACDHHGLLNTYTWPREAPVPAVAFGKQKPTPVHAGSVGQIEPVPKRSSFPIAGKCLTHRLPDRHERVPHRWTGRCDRPHGDRQRIAWGHGPGKRRVQVCPDARKHLGRHRYRFCMRHAYAGVRKLLAQKVLPVTGTLPPSVKSILGPGFDARSMSPRDRR